MVTINIMDATRTMLERKEQLDCAVENINPGFNAIFQV